jgi:predicted DCC family thiol-disulfide oxidoreductase YuxK
MPTPTLPAALPSPAARPDADVVIFDGECSMCTAQVAKLLRWDGGQRLAYISLHDPEVQRRWPDMGHDRLMQEMAVVDRRGHRHWGPEAIRYLTGRLPRLWWAAPFTHFPGSMVLWRPLYRWVARNRYRFSGQRCENGACSLHAK